ncbi:MAG: hypothetical protein K2X81_03160 [Candidatus Obscuribacterales bacterium]|nr:hypothetical protein [Candidatus Obscuribacterales bacterium]
MKALNHSITGLLMLLLYCGHAPVSAQNIEKRFRDLAPANIVEEDRYIHKVVPRVLENRVLIAPNNVNDSGLRSNYARRLSDIAEQLSMAYSKGWVTKAQYDYFRNWQASVGMEEAILRNNSMTGKVSTDEAAQLERHMTGLEYTINKQIDAGSKVATQNQ